MFGVVFPDRTFPMDASSFTQIDPLHWLLDTSTFPGDAPKQICIFLLNNLTLPPTKALAVYIQPEATSPFAFCGAVHAARPSAVLSLPWPEEAVEKGKIGVSVEDLATLPPVTDAAAQGRVERVAMKVGENLFNFMQSFCGVDGSKLIVPMDVLDRWFKKFKERASKDPEYIKGFLL